MNFLFGGIIIALFFSSFYSPLLCMTTTSQQQYNFSGRLHHLRNFHLAALLLQLGLFRVCQFQQSHFFPVNLSSSRRHEFKKKMLKIVRLIFPKKLVKNLVDFPGQLQTCSSRSQDNWELLCSIGLTFKGLQLPSF